MNRNRILIIVGIMAIVFGFILLTPIRPPPPPPPQITNTVRVISEWQALRVAFGSSRNFTTLPPPYPPQANLTVTLELVAFYAWLPSGPYNLTSGGYNETIIPVDNQTGLPTKPLAIYPSGPFESYGECLQYMYVWDIEEFPAPYSHGGSILIDAVSAQQMNGDLRGISFGLTCGTSSTRPASTQTQTPTSMSSVSLLSVGLCASNCTYIEPSLRGTMLVNGSVPLLSLHLFINGTDEGIITGPNATTTILLRTSYTFAFETQPNNSAMPIIAGKTYTILIVATFQDNSTGTVSVTVVAGAYDWRKNNSISLQAVGLCASNCVYPSPYLSATVFVNASVPLSTLHLFINGTTEGWGFYSTTTANTMANYSVVFKAHPVNPDMPIVAGKTYTITLVATFQDESTYTASIIVVASSW